MTQNDQDYFAEQVATTRHALQAAAKVLKDAKAKHTEAKNAHEAAVAQFVTAREEDD